MNSVVLPPFGKPTIPTWSPTGAGRRPSSPNPARLAHEALPCSATEHEPGSVTRVERERPDSSLSSAFSSASALFALTIAPRICPRPARSRCARIRRQPPDHLRQDAVHGVRMHERDLEPEEPAPPPGRPCAPDAKPSAHAECTSPASSAMWCMPDRAARGTAPPACPRPSARQLDAAPRRGRRLDTLLRQRVAVSGVAPNSRSQVTIASSRSATAMPTWWTPRRRTRRCYPWRTARQSRLRSIPAAVRTVPVWTSATPASRPRAAPRARRGRASPSRGAPRRRSSDARCFISSRAPPRTRSR